MTQTGQFTGSLLILKKCMDDKHNFSGVACKLGHGITKKKSRNILLIMDMHTVHLYIDCFTNILSSFTTYYHKPGSTTWHGFNKTNFKSIYMGNLANHIFQESGKNVSTSPSQLQKSVRVTLLQAI